MANTRKTPYASKTTQTKTENKKASEEVTNDTFEASETADETNNNNNSIEVENTTETVETEVVTEVAASSPIVGYQVKKTLPMDAMVIVRNATAGKLVYVSKKTIGYTETWYTLGEEIPMQMSELYSMKNSDRAFFTENWIELDPIVLRDLQMERFYERYVPVGGMDNLFNMEVDKLIETMKNMKLAYRNAFALEAIKRIENGTLTNFKTITAIENTLHCELYER